MYIKRDDMTGMQLSGNKVRKIIAKDKPFKKLCRHSCAVQAGQEDRVLGG